MINYRYLDNKCDQKFRFHGRNIIASLTNAWKISNIALGDLNSEMMTIRKEWSNGTMKQLSMVKIYPITIGKGMKEVK
jgi:hypothetical protein